MFFFFFGGGEWFGKVRKNHPSRWVLFVWCFFVDSSKYFQVWYRKSQQIDIDQLGTGIQGFGYAGKGGVISTHLTAFLYEFRRQLFNNIHQFAVLYLVNPWKLIWNWQLVFIHILVFSLKNKLYIKSVHSDFFPAKKTFSRFHPTCVFLKLPFTDQEGRLLVRSSGASFAALFPQLDALIGQATTPFFFEKKNQGKMKT